VKMMKRRKKNMKMTLSPTKKAAVTEAMEP
jgi:hypothetical protein